MNERRKPQLLFPALIAILVVVLAIWGFYAFMTGNSLWFQSAPKRSYAPVRVVIHYYGTTTALEPGSEAFQEINVALNQSLSDFRGRIPVGLSEETLHDYREQEYVLEVFFADDIGPVIGLKTPLNQLLIPVDGRHSGNRYVFMGHNDRWLPSALVMAEMQPLLDTLNDLGYTIQ